jgi:hypothetical protein
MRSKKGCKGFLGTRGKKIVEQEKELEKENVYQMKTLEYL